jgi:hypothetical protein
MGMIERLALALEKQVLTIPKTSPIVSELLSFRRVGKKLEASPGNHDDTVMALAICLSQTDFKPVAGISIDTSKIKIVRSY